MSEAYTPKHSINPNKSPEHVAQQVDHITEGLDRRARRVAEEFADAFDIVGIAVPNGGHGIIDSKEGTDIEASFLSAHKNGKEKLDVSSLRPSTGARNASVISRKKHKLTLTEERLAKENPKYHIRGDDISIEAEGEDGRVYKTAIGSKKTRITGRDKRTIRFNDEHYRELKGRKQKKQGERALVKSLSQTRNAIAVVESSGDRLKGDQQASNIRRRLSRNEEELKKLEDRKAQINSNNKGLGLGTSDEKRINDLEMRAGDLKESSAELREAHSLRQATLQKQPRPDEYDQLGDL